MTVRQIWVQAQEYNAIDDRQMLAALLPLGTSGPIGSVYGLRDASDLFLTMTTDVAGTVSKGAAYIPFSSSLYLLTNDAPQAVTFAPADPTNGRIDILVAQVQDAEIGGASGAAQIAVIAGVPAASPIPPAVPDGCLLLNTIRFDAGSTAPVNTRNAAQAVPSIQQVVPAGYLREPAELTAYRDGGLVVGHGVWTVTGITGKTWSKGVGLGTAPPGVVVDQAGRYRVEGTGAFPYSNAGARRGVGACISGIGNPNPSQLKPWNASYSTLVYVSQTIWAEKDQAVTLAFYQDSGANLTVTGIKFSVKREP